MLLARPCLAKRSMEGNYMGFVPITNQITNINVSTIIVIICEKLNSLAQYKAQSRAQYSSFTLSGSRTLRSPGLASLLLQLAFFFATSFAIVTISNQLLLGLGIAVMRPAADPRADH